MTFSKPVRYLATALAMTFVLGDFELAGHQIGAGIIKLAGDAEARVGHPLTPASGAGVARRTTRRTLRRGAYIATLPHNCVYGTYNGYKLYRCGGTYYQPSGSGYVVVYF